MWRYFNYMSVLSLLHAAETKKTVFDNAHTMAFQAKIAGAELLNC
jgi:hypothetical protein